MKVGLSASAQPVLLLILPSPARINLLFCMSSQEEVVRADSLLVSHTWLEIAAIYNTAARATDFTYLRPAPLQVPFHSANENEGCRLGYFVKSRGAITNPHYPSFCRAWSVFPWRKAAADPTLLKAACLSLHAWEAHRGGCYHKGPICYPGFTPSQEALFGTFIYQEKAVNASKKVCTLSLRHWGYWLHSLRTGAE